MNVLVQGCDTKQCYSLIPGFPTQRSQLSPMHPRRTATGIMHHSNKVEVAKCSVPHQNSTVLRSYAIITVCLLQNPQIGL